MRVYLLLTLPHFSSLLPGVKERRTTSLNYTFSGINWVDAFLGLPLKILRVCSLKTILYKDRYSITLCREGKQRLKPSVCIPGLTGFQMLTLTPISFLALISALSPLLALFYLQVLAKLHVNASGMHSE